MAAGDKDSDDGFGALTAKISTDRGFACASYKERCLRRRVAVRMRARGVHLYADYAALLDQDAAEYDRLVESLTINVTRFFRDADAWASLAATVIPELWHSQRPELRAWSAGCSSGEEPLTLAMLFHRQAATSGMLSQLSRVRILGTDLDAGALDAARLGTYAGPELAEMPEEYRTRYLSPLPPHMPVQAIAAMVEYRRHDLLRDPPPLEGVQLVVCRNVLIYFDRDTQEHVVRTFQQVLEPGGFLFLGRVETLPAALRTLFTVVDARHRIFRRL
jgi:chemotaxis methyl-accepting protein methylase